MRILQFGRTGQLAREMLDRAPSHGAEVVALGREDVDLADMHAVERAVMDASPAPDLVVNAAAYTNVDGAESDEETARLVNAEAPAAMARACAVRGLPLIHVSTDYVFDGSASGPYREDAPTGPIGAYGRTKAEGEKQIRLSLDHHIIIRTAWVFSPYGRNFVKTMLRLGAERDTLSIVDDQHGCPTAAGDLAEAILTAAGAIQDGRDHIWGVYHFVNAGETTWRRFAEAIFEGWSARGGKTPRVTPITTEDFPTPAPRPRNSVLSAGAIEQTFGVVPRPWAEALDETLDVLAGGRNGS